jgi:hypothetical protein
VRRDLVGDEVPNGALDEPVLLGRAEIDHAGILRARIATSNGAQEVCQFVLVAGQTRRTLSMMLGADVPFVTL